MEHPILFSTKMVKAILAGQKTQTRRVIIPTRTKPHITPMEVEPWLLQEVDNRGRLIWQGYHPEYPTAYKWFTCPYGKPGDTLWVRETCCLFSISGIDGSKTNPEMWTIKYKAGNGLKTVSKKNKPWGHFNKWTPSIHMPRWASRLILSVAGVRVERLQDISEADAKAEGVLADVGSIPFYGEYKDPFYRLWQYKRPGWAWDDNPWVWVVEFKISSRTA